MSEIIPCNLTRLDLTPVQFFAVLLSWWRIYLIEEMLQHDIRVNTYMTPTGNEIKSFYLKFGSVLMHRFLILQYARGFCSIGLLVQSKRYRAMWNDTFIKTLTINIKVNSIAVYTAIRNMHALMFRYIVLWCWIYQYM